MKNLLFLFTIVLFFMSCENVENNSPAFQANVDNIFFKSDATITDRANHVVEMIGNSEEEKITLNFRLDEGDNIVLDGETLSSATYEDKFGNVYSTGEGAEGKIQITSRSGGNRVVSGKFNFTAILQGIDTITISKGIFYEVRTIN